MANNEAALEQMRNDPKLQVLVKGCYSLSVDFGLVSGKKKASADDIGLTLADIPEDVISLGSKQVLPPEVMKKLNKLKSEVEGRLSTIGFKIHGIWNLPLETYDEINTFITGKEDEFYQIKKHLITNVANITNKWAEQADLKYPGMNMGDKIRGSAYTSEYIARQVRFDTLFWQDANEIASQSLFEDIAKTASARCRQIGEPKYQCKTRSCLKELIEIRSKLSTLSFIDPEASTGVITRIDRFLNSLPKTGRLPHSIKEDLLVEYGFLANVENIKALNSLRASDESSEGKSPTVKTVKPRPRSTKSTENKAGLDLNTLTPTSTPATVDMFTSMGGIC